MPPLFSGKILKNEQNMKELPLFASLAVDGLCLGDDNGFALLLFVLLFVITVFILRVVFNRLVSSKCLGE
jgi:hypothetical protein